jgi:zeaxanthin epoxidase
MAGRVVLQRSALQGRPSTDVQRTNSSSAASRRFSLDTNVFRQNSSVSRCIEAPAAQRVVLTQAASGNGAGPSTREEAPQQTIDLDAKAEASGLPRILIAGGGIGGLIAAVALLKRGYPVQVFERDLTAIRGEGKYRGPIQIQSNALAALEAIDLEMAQSIMEEGCVTGDRINGLCDGVTGDWYVKFDTFHPAVDLGLPVTRVISRVVLQKKLAEKAEEMEGAGVLANDCHVVDYEESTCQKTGKKVVTAILEDGRRFEGDILIGADGIWSKVRRKLIGESQPNYSQYTCYTGISDFTPPDIDTVGYRVFLGNGRYFVSSDVGGGKMQWYAFHKEAAGGKDEPNRQKERLLSIFGDWADAVTDLIRATPEADVLRRDIYDRPPIFTWSKGRVALLGDSAHAMQPNLGQGGCMAIEDGYQLSLTLDEAVHSVQPGAPVDIEGALRKYQSQRLVRASSIHGLAGMAAIMASTYKAYMGEGLGDFGKWLMKFKIPHFGKVGGKVAMDLTMPTMLAWVLGGNANKLRFQDRAPHCRLPDKPKTFHEQDFGKFMRDDAELLRAANAQWAVVPMTNEGREGTEPTTEPAVMICDDECCAIGRDGDCNLILDEPTAAERHAEFTKEDGHHYVCDLGTPSGTWLNDKRVDAGSKRMLRPGDILEFGQPGSGLRYKIKMYHRSERERLERSWDASASEKREAAKEKVAA